MKRLLKVIYVGAISPLVIGSFTFFYWYYNRTWYAHDVDIELFTFFTILCFLLFSSVTLILSAIFIYKNRTDWKKTITPILIIGLTFPIIDLYGALHSSLSEKAYLRILNDTEDSIVSRIWSDNFERTYFENEREGFVISYYPVYRYDWNQRGSISYYYEVNQVYIDVLELTNTSTSTYELGRFSKGDCATIRLTELIEKTKTTR